MPHTIEFLVERELRGIRIDSFLLCHLRNYTPFRLQRLIRHGAVKVDGAPVELAHRVYPGQRIAICLIEPPDKLFPPEDAPLHILFEDPWLVVIDKPPGLTAHPAASIQRGTLVHRLQAHLDRQTPLKGLLRPGIVHRLDRETSGVMVATKHHLAHARLGTQFEEKRVQKTYLALVEGLVDRDAGTIDLPIGRAASAGSILMSCKAGAREARPARTRYEVVARYAAHSLVRAMPLTGRQHQIRIHFAEAGHAVVGDEFYARHGEIRSTKAEWEARRAVERVSSAERSAIATPRFGSSEAYGVTRHALHAERLGFAHPVTNEWLEFAAPLAADIKAFVQTLGGAP
ncbi:MAG: RluA family pseudouridine synthase [Planctomycetes bacterium]|nr:RluA family pseudouridine synthase [Planctomycetota bacterium]